MGRTLHFEESELNLMQTITGIHYRTLEPVTVRIEDGKITAVDAAASDGPLPFVAPAFFDLQINGYKGVWFGHPGITAEDVLATLEPHFGFGLTRMFPTLVTNSRENLIGGFAAIREACEREAWADRLVAGCHLEGPYLSPEDGPRGAHPKEHIRAADWDEFCEFQSASGNRIRLVTVAPEQTGAIEFIRRAVAAGVVCSIGHTGAEPEQIREAVEAGARMSTHLGNGAHGMIRRHPNYIWEQLADDRLTAGIIPDGYHLPASVIKCILRVKSPERAIITCDASGLAGCPPGVYSEGSTDVEVLEDGRIVVAGQRQYLAGSGASTETCVGYAVVAGEVSLADACDMAGCNVSRLFGLEEFVLNRGSTADVTVFDFDRKTGKIRIRATLAGGELRYGDLPDGSAA